MNYGRAIKILRATRNISQKKLSYLTKLDCSYISRIESGERKPAINTLEKISKELEIPFYLLILLSSNTTHLENSDSESIQRLSKALLDIVIESDSEVVQ